MFWCQIIVITVISIQVKTRTLHTVNKFGAFQTLFREVLQKKDLFIDRVSFIQVS